MTSYKTCCCLSSAASPTRATAVATLGWRLHRLGSCRRPVPAPARLPLSTRPAHGPGLGVDTGWRAGSCPERVVLTSGMGAGAASQGRQARPEPPGNLGQVDTSWPQLPSQDRGDCAGQRRNVGMGAAEWVVRGQRRPPSRYWGTQGQGRHERARLGARVLLQPGIPHVERGGEEGCGSRDIRAA